MEKNAKPYVIAGPCSVESRQQLREASLQLSAIHGVRMIRAGVWKPRTRPGGFEGLGEPALQWMQEVGRELGVSYCCEVAIPEHVDLCRQYGIATVWIGARTTANPFMVEELCYALGGSGMAVLVKNPVCPDVRLWLGAIERLQQAGIADIMAIHRGFSMSDNQGYRNAPLWEVAMELRRERPDIPILCDPSHIGGRRELVAPLAQTAMLLDYDGLMIESHPHPDDAWTDGQQQLSPDQLASLLAALPSPSGNAAAGNPGLEQLRHQIDSIDHELVRLLGQRMAVSRSMAALKRQFKMSVYQRDRWDDVVSDRLKYAAEAGLDAGFTKELLEKIHAESVRVQMEDRAQEA